MFQTTLYIYLSEGITPELGVYPNIVKLVVKLFITHRLLGAGERLTPQIFTVTSPAPASGSGRRKHAT